MNEPLKRTFHGCLTCRKRKVRCRGGSPCQNCSKMNITCHSSFDTNLRMSVVSPSGQRDVPVRAATPVSTATLAVPTVSAPAAVPTSIPHLETPLFPSPSFGSSEASNLFVPSGYDQLDPLLFPGNAHHGILGLGEAWDFDFSLQPFAAQSHLTAHAADEIPSDSSFPQPDPFAAFNVGDSRGSSVLVDYSLGAPAGLLPPGQQRLAPGEAQKATEEWSPRRRKRSRSSVQKTSKKSASQPATPQSGADPDAVYLHHYRTCMCGALTLRKEEQWTYNRYLYDLMRDAPRDLPLRLATLAWAAKHFANTTTDRADDDSWRAYYAEADAGLSKLAPCWSESSSLTQPARDETVSSSSETGVTTPTRPVFSAVEMTICTSIMLCRADVLNSDLPSVSARLCALRDNLHQHRDTPLRLSAFASRVLLWLCYLHVRVSLFSPDPYLDSNQITLFDVVLQRPDCSQLQARSHHYLAEIFGSSYPPSEYADDLAMAESSQRLHGVFEILALILRFRSAPSPSEKQTLAQSITAAIADAESAFTDVTPPPPPPPPPPSRSSAASTDEASLPSRAEMHSLSAQAALLTAKILWARFWDLYQSSPPTSATISTSTTSTTSPSSSSSLSAPSYPPQTTAIIPLPPPPTTPAINAILSIALHLRRVAPAKILRAMLWPLPVFVAGIETPDPVYADWIAHFVRDVEDSAATGAGAGGSGGAGGKRVVELMARVRQRQDLLGRRVAVEDVVADMRREPGGHVTSCIF